MIIFRSVLFRCHLQQKQSINFLLFFLYFFVDFFVDFFLQRNIVLEGREQTAALLITLMYCKLARLEPAITADHDAPKQLPKTTVINNLYQGLHPQINNHKKSAIINKGKIMRMGMFEDNRALRELAGS